MAEKKLSLKSRSGDMKRICSIKATAMDKLKITAWIPRVHKHQLNPMSRNSEYPPKYSEDEHCSLLIDDEDLYCVGSARKHNQQTLTWPARSWLITALLSLGVCGTIHPKSRKPLSCAGCGW
jgi:hypothetical protein